MVHKIHFADFLQYGKKQAYENIRVVFLIYSEKGGLGHTKDGKEANFILRYGELKTLISLV